MQWLERADPALIVIAQSQKGSDSSVAEAKGAEQILIWGVGGTLFLSVQNSA